MDGTINVGKIKVEFTKEAFYTGEGEDNRHKRQINEIWVNPPMLVTVYTISAFDLRSVHPFSKNRPVVRAHCTRWKAATKVSGERLKYRPTHLLLLHLACHGFAKTFFSIRSDLDSFTLRNQ